MATEQVTLMMANRAREGLAAFETSSAEDRLSPWLRDDAPEWLGDAVYEAHGPEALLPDVWRFRFARDALRRIAESDPDDTRHTMAQEIVPDADYHALVTWRGSSASRQSYCDDASSREGEFNTTAELLAAGQVRERQLVFQIIWNALASMNHR